MTSETALHAALDRTADESRDAIDHVVHAAAIGSGKFGFPFTQLRAVPIGRGVMNRQRDGDGQRRGVLDPHLIARSNGTSSSSASIAGQSRFADRSSLDDKSKAANINFAQCLAKDLAPHSIRVNTVCPGMVQTPLNRLTWQSWQNQNPAGKQPHL